MEPNPFNFATPVAPAQLIDREHELETLLALAAGGHFAALVAPRRYGKTSLLRALAELAGPEGMDVVHVDLYALTSMTAAAERIATAYAALQGRSRQRVRSMLRDRLGVDIGAGPVRVRLTATPRKDGLALLEETLELPRDLSERTGRRTLVILDEFQELVSVGERIDGVIRAHIQHHAEFASYVFAGSAPSLMRELFSRGERPLYGQARIEQLGPLPDEALADYILDRFKRTGRPPGAGIERLLALACGHPQRAMLLAHFLWEQATDEADIEAWQAALNQALQQAAEGFEGIWSACSSPERAVLAAIATGQPVLSRRTLDLYGVSKASAQTARDRLVHAGEHLTGHERTITFVDPLFAEWIRGL